MEEIITFVAATSLASSKHLSGANELRILDANFVQAGLNYVQAGRSSVQAEPNYVPAERGFVPRIRVCFLSTGMSSRHKRAELCGVRWCLSWEMKFHRMVGIITLAIAIIVLLPIGSLEDRAILALVFASSRSTAIKSGLREIQDCIGVDAWRYFSLSFAWSVWAWGNARARLGHGPFHFVDVPGVWRGYPFIFEEWIFVLNPTVKTWREFHWLGVVADIVILTLASFLISRRFAGRQPVCFSLCAAALSAIFVWLNVEPWADGVPVSLRWPVPGSWAILTRGFPWKYKDTASVGEEVRTLAANVVLGFSLWSLMFVALKAVGRLNGLTRRRIDDSPS